MHKTSLHDTHEALGGKIVDFNGWALPIQFAGIVKEHTHTRTQASLFDCSHMGEYTVKGADAIEQFSKEIISDLSKIPVGRCRYGALLNEDGGIIDDLITFRMAEDELYVVTNAGPLAVVTERLCGSNPGMENVSFETSKVDIQGPLARECALKAGFSDVESLKYFNALWTTWEGHRVLLARTGYTGELGYELFMSNEIAEEVWKRFNAMDVVEPAGLGARDTLRTEVGYGLSGQDFNTAYSPLESNMQPFINWGSEFVGKEALVAQRDANEYSVLVPIQTSSRKSPRHDFEVFDGDTVVGTVTTGTFGPSVGYGIGFARVPQSLSSVGTKLTAGPKKIEIEVGTIPFYAGGTCRVKI
jgi:aminomethyltransferase